VHGGTKSSPGARLVGFRFRRVDLVVLARLAERERGRVCGYQDSLARNLGVPCSTFVAAAVAAAAAAAVAAAAGGERGFFSQLSVPTLTVAVVLPAIEMCEASLVPVKQRNTGTISRYRSGLHRRKTRTRAMMVSGEEEDF